MPAVASRRELLSDDDQSFSRRVRHLPAGRKKSGKEVISVRYEKPTIEALTNAARCGPKQHAESRSASGRKSHPTASAYEADEYVCFPRSAPLLALRQFSSKLAFEKGSRERSGLRRCKATGGVQLTFDPVQPIGDSLPHISDISWGTQKVVFTPIANEFGPRDRLLYNALKNSSPC